MAGSLSQQAYDKIRKRILTLKLAPGEMINEAELVGQLEIGRTPVREALQRLASQHFVEVRPRKGTFVTEIDTEHLPLLFETRAVLEPYAARLAAERGDSNTWDEMEALLDRTDNATSKSSALLDVDRTCHEMIWDAASNPFLTDTLDSLYAQSERTWHRYLAGVADMGAALDEHRRMLDVMRSGDANAAETIMHGHVIEFMDEIQTVLRTTSLADHNS